MSHKLKPAPRIRGLNFHLRMLAFSALLPVLIVGGIAVWLASGEFRDHSQHRLEETASVLAHGVDEGIENRIEQLQLLSRLNLTANELADGIGGLGPGIYTDELAASHGVPSTLLASARASGRPQISDLLISADGHPPQVVIALPTRGKGDAGPVLSLVLPSNELISTIMRSADQQSLLVAVVDSHGRIAARSRDPEKFWGQPVPDWDRLQAVGESQGLFHAATKEGAKVVFAFQMLQAAPGWALVIGEPRRALEARWQRPLAGIGFGGLLAALIAMFASRFIAQRILTPLQALTERGQRIVATDNPMDPTQIGTAPIESSVTEFRLLEQSMNDAVVALRDRAEDARKLTVELTESEQRYRAIAEAGAMVLWEADRNGKVKSATGWRELTGQANELALGNGWLRRVHEEDVAPLELAVENGATYGKPLDSEFRVLDQQEQWRWIRARGAYLRQSDQTIKWVGVLEDVHARRQAQARIAYMAHHDALTGLPNRVQLLERLDQAMSLAARGQSAALLLLDLDRFKEVNDTLGHPIGDQLLCEISRRLSACLRPTDTIARMGGDEFAILIDNDNTTPEAIATLAHRLQQTASRVVQLEGHEVTVGASIGIVMIDALSLSADQAMRNADLALYRAKEEGRDRFCFFEADMDTRMQRRRRQELELRTAMNQQQFQIRYQPLVDLKSHRIKGFEALLYWNHPTDGTIEAGQFLPLAEEIGLMTALGEWVLQHACRDAVEWPEPLKLAVNLSASQLTQPDLLERVEKILRTTHLPPNRLELEVTENALLANIELASARLLPLKASGISIVMDGFGTGYSSLGYLRAFPFDKVKIDRSFIRDLGQQRDGSAIISAISHLCERLGITATAEGVETHNQLRLLRQEQCGEGQGQVFGGPVRPEQIEALIRDWPGAMS